MDPREQYGIFAGSLGPVLELGMMIGQGLEPRGHDPMADVMPVDELRAKLRDIHAVIAKSAEVMPDHMRFIADNCAAQ